MTEKNQYISNDTKGNLVLIGGAEDKRRDKRILKRILNLNNADNIVIIPSASSSPKGISDDYYYAFRKLGAKKINTLDIRKKSEADKMEHLEKIESAELIFFTGGDQVKLVNILGNTKLLKNILIKYKEGATIAGTSAGAAAASDPMIYDGDYRGLTKGSIQHSEGFGFINNLTIDTHFIARGRLLRLSQFLTTGLSQKGIGLGEDTAIIIYPSEHFEVLGSGVVTVVNGKDITYNNYEKIDTNNRLNINGLKIGFLHEGCIFDLNDWKVVSTCLADYQQVPIEIMTPRMNI
ncbi:MAG: cyanophycinase [Bacteroidales bacterium]|nr:cyanophycinase [Bacteroidales bacterium]